MSALKRATAYVFGAFGVMIGGACYTWDIYSIKDLRRQVKKYDFFSFFFSKISYFLERVLVEHIDMKDSLDSSLQTCSLCSIRIRSRKLDMFKKPQQLNSNLSVYY